MTTGQRPLREVDQFFDPAARCPHRTVTLTLISVVAPRTPARSLKSGRSLRVTAGERVFSIYHLPRASPGAILSHSLAFSRNAADTVGLNGIYVPVECILIIRAGVFGPAATYVKFSRRWSRLCVYSFIVSRRPLYTYGSSGSLIRPVLSSRWL